jgi:hypothetical protein
VKPYKWRAVNVRTSEKDFTKIVSPELVQNIMTRLRQDGVSSSLIAMNCPK